MKETIIQIFSEIVASNEDLDVGVILNKIIKSTHKELTKMSDDELLDAMTEIQAELELN